MTLFDLPYDALALIIRELRLRDQLSLRPLCRQSRDLTAGAAMANRLAHLLFFQPMRGMRGVYEWFLPGVHPSVWRSHLFDLKMEAKLTLIAKDGSKAKFGRKRLLSVKVLVMRTR